MIPFLVYLAFALLTTWPLAGGLGVMLPGFSGDMALYVWFIDTFWSAVAAGESPLTTTRIFYPVGQSLLYSSGGPAIAVLAWPFWYFGGTSGIIAFYGVLVIAAIVVGALGMRAAVAALTGDGRAAFWAGLFFGGCPAVLSFVGSPFYFRLAGGVMLPWGLWALARFAEPPHRGRYLLALSALVWMLFFTDPYMLFALVLLAAVFGLCTFRPGMLRPLLAAAAANAVLGAALLRALPVTDPYDFGTGLWDKANANLADLFVPGPLPQQSAAQYFHGVLAGLSRFATDWGCIPSSYFIGIGVGVILLFGSWRRGADRRVVALGIVAILLILLSCGTAMRWAGWEIVRDRWTLFYWLVQVPWFRLFDNPASFQLAVATATIALFGMALATLRVRPYALHALALGVFVLDYAQIGIPTTTLTVPKVYTVLATRPRATLLELPGGITESKGGLGLNTDGIDNNPAMYWQTIHRQPRVSGYVARVPHTTFEWFFHEPVIGDLLTLTGNQGSFQCYHGERRSLEHLPEYPPEAVDRFVAEFDIGYVVFRPCREQARFEEEVDRLLGSRIVSREVIDGYALYTVRH